MDDALSRKAGAVGQACGRHIQAFAARASVEAAAKPAALLPAAPLKWARMVGHNAIHGKVNP